MKISGYMYKFQDLTPISGQISKFQECRDNAQAWLIGFNDVDQSKLLPKYYKIK